MAGLNAKIRKFNAARHIREAVPRRSTAELQSQIRVSGKAARAKNISARSKAFHLEDVRQSAAELARRVGAEATVTAGKRRRIRM
jgi:hypothetical protein